MNNKSRNYFIVLAVLGGLFIYLGIRAFTYDGSKLGAALPIILGLVLIYASYSIYQGKWDRHF